jgi:hypothetical protein
MQVFGQLFFIDFIFLIFVLNSRKSLAMWNLFITLRVGQARYQGRLTSNRQDIKNAPLW